MAQVTDRTVGANPTGFDMRIELNNIIAALESDNSGSSEPLNPVAYMKWLDTSNATYYYYKERNHDNTAWVTLFRYTVATKIMEAVSNGVVLQDSALVHKTGDETIAGVKTFSSSPIVPTPTTGTQAANKDYVDSRINSTPTITGSATFNGTTQKITMTDIGNITLAIGDVIEVTGTTSNNKLFTVESIVDNNNIVVNYEHRGTYTPAPKGRLINETASNCTIKLYNRAKNAPTGQGQYWCVPASGRTSGSPYTNTSQRSLQITFSSTSSTGEIQGYINGEMVAIGFDGTSQNASIFMEVEPSSEYKIISPTTNDWRERR